MPFTPAKSQVNPVELILRLRDARLQQEAAEQKAQIDAQKFAIEMQKFDMERQNHALGLAKQVQEMRDAQKTREQAAAPSLQAANDPNLTNPERYAAGKDFVRQLEENMVTRAAGADVAGTNVFGHRTVDDVAQATGGNVGVAEAVRRSEGFAKRDEEVDRENRTELNLENRESRKVERVDRNIAAAKKALGKTGLSESEREKLETRFSSQTQLRQKILSGGNFEQKRLADKAIREGRDGVRRKAAVLKSLRALKEDAKNNPRVLGTRGYLGNAIMNIGGVAADIANTVMPDVQNAAAAGDMPDWAQQVFLKGVDPETGTAIEAAKLLEYQIAWDVMSQTRTGGRPTALEYERIKEMANFTGGGVSSQKAINRIVAADRTLQRGLRNELLSLRAMQGEVDFDGKNLEFRDEAGLDFGISEAVSDKVVTGPVPPIPGGEPAGAVTFDNLPDAPTSEQLREAALELIKANEGVR